GWSDSIAGTRPAVSRHARRWYRMNRWKTWLLNGVLALGSIGVTLAIAEVAVRLLAPQPTGLAHQYRYGLALHYPGITRFLPQYGPEVSFNAVGMRDTQHPLA